MYSESELSKAVEAGVIPAETASDFRYWAAQQRNMPAADEEHFRLITGFNDIFVAIAAIIALIAASAIGGGLLVAAAAWALAEFFTRKRRMAFPSIVLLIAFSGGVFSGLMGFLHSSLEPNMLLVSAIGFTTFGATYLHWRRFQVPIAIAAMTAALVGCVLALILSAIDEELHSDILMMLAAAAGICVFAFAMYWDMQDRARKTGKSDVAFWLHLLSAPLIVHPLFMKLGAFGGELSNISALLILAVYCLFGLIALAVDRRAILVSALAYVLAALASLFDEMDGLDDTIALTALIIGGALLALSAFWSHLRAALVSKLPESWRARLPVTHLDEDAGSGRITTG